MRILEDILRATHLNDASIIDNRNRVADLLRHEQRMGDENERNAEFFVDIFEQPKDRLRGHGVKSTRSFIAEHDRWTIDERTGDRHALLLSTRKLRRILVRLIGKTYQLQQFERTLARFSLL